MEDQTRVPSHPDGEPHKTTRASLGPGALLTFDCYGTLIDWEAGILAALRSAYPRAAQVDDDALLEAFHSAQNTLKTSEYRSYRQLLTEVSAQIARTNEWDESTECSAKVPASIPSWCPFPDTNAALARLAAGGVTLGILSNIDNDLLVGTLQHFDVSFALLATAQNLQSYKPASRHFARGREWAAEYQTWYHVAQSLFHDVIPATALGIPVVWVNRKQETQPAEARPEFVADDLTDAVDWLLGV